MARLTHADIDELALDGHRVGTAAPPRPRTGLIEPGARNSTLTSIAGALAHVLGPEILPGVLHGLNEHICSPPLPREEVDDLAPRAAEWSEEAAALRSPIDWLDLDAIGRQGLPVVPELVPGWLHERDIALMAGSAGIGKTTLAAALAYALASGTSWCGITPTRAVRVIYLDEEQDSATTARLMLQLGPANANLHVASGQDVRLDTKAGIERLRVAIEDVGADVVVIDSVQQAFGDVDENNATEVGAVYRELFRLRDRYDVTFVLIHHKRKGQGGNHSEKLELVRGSTAHGTQSSTVWYCYLRSNLLNMVQVKRRNGQKVSLSIAYAEDRDRIILTASGAASALDTAVERASESIVDLLAGQGTMKRSAIESAAAAAGHAEKTVGRALNELVREGIVEKPRHGYYTLTGGES